MSERVIENQLLSNSVDLNSSFEEKMQISKIRKLDRSIGNNLKMFYGYRCQICGELIGEEYSAHVVEAHLIDYFVKIINNNSSNQLIVCPNHNRIIHKVNPVFDRKNKVFNYSNEKNKV